MHISENRLEGSLLDTGLKEVLEECHAHLVTGTLSIAAGDSKAVLEIRAGAVDSVDYKGLKRTEALAELHELKDGEFELCQKLPDLSGELGDAAALETESDEVSIVKLMQLCEDNALSCSINATAGDDEAEIHYKAGEIDNVVWNGEDDVDRIVDVVKMEKAKLRVSAPPLKLGILSWPTVRDDPTPAFIPIQEMAAHKIEAETTAKPVAAKPQPTKVKASKRPEPEETSAAVVLLGLVIGLVVVAGALVFGVKALVGG